MQVRPLWEYASFQVYLTADGEYFVFRTREYWQNSTKWNVAERNHTSLSWMTFQSYTWNINIIIVVEYLVSWFQTRQLSFMYLTQLCEINEPFVCGLCLDFDWYQSRFSYTNSYYTHVCSCDMLWYLTLQLFEFLSIFIAAYTSFVWYVLYILVGTSSLVLVTLSSISGYLLHHTLVHNVE